MGTPTAMRRPAHLVSKLPIGWMVTAAKFEVEWPAEPDRAALVRSHFGARRFAFNWGLAQVKADLDAKAVDPGHESVGWDLGSLRKVWNRAKDEVAPWWATNSQGVLLGGSGRPRAGVEQLERQARTATGRAGGWVSRGSNPARRDPGRVRFTTGTMRLEDDRRTITVPVIGGASVQGEHPPGAAPPRIGPGADPEHDAVAAVGPAVRIDRLRAAHPDHRAHAWPSPRCVAGVDLGVRTLATVATLDTATGAETIVEYPNPAPLKATLWPRRRQGWA